MTGKLNTRALRVAELIRAGTTKPSDIIAAINQQPDLAYSPKEVARPSDEKAFQRDIIRLRGLGMDFTYDRASGQYVESTQSNPKLSLSLSAEELAVLAQLPDAYRHTPQREAAKRLHERVVGLLDNNSRKRLGRVPVIQIRLDMLDELSQHISSAQIVEQAAQESRDLIFQYQMAGHVQAYEMRVQVLTPLELKDGHVYFDAQSLKSGEERTFRLSRIVPGTAKLLPVKRASRQRRSNAFQLQYWLAANVEPTRHFPQDFKLARRPDGAIVSAMIEERDMFRASKILLRYGQNCIVINPPALVDEMRRNVEQMARHYGLLE